VSEDNVLGVLLTGSKAILLKQRQRKCSCAFLCVLETIRRSGPERAPNFFGALIQVLKQRTVQNKLALQQTRAHKSQLARVEQEEEKIGAAGGRGRMEDRGALVWSAGGGGRICEHIYREGVIQK
jgi:hypothetical protein